MLNINCNNHATSHLFVLLNMAVFSVGKLRLEGNSGFTVLFKDASLLIPPSPPRKRTQQPKATQRRCTLLHSKCTPSHTVCRSRAKRNRLPRNFHVPSAQSCGFLGVKHSVVEPPAKQYSVPAQYVQSQTHSSKMDPAGVKARCCHVLYEQMKNAPSYPTAVLLLSNH